MTKPPIDRKLNANRQSRALAKLDKALGRKSKPAVETKEQRARRELANRPHRDATASYDALKRAILGMGGLRATRDFSRSQIPADLYRPRSGKAPDEAAQMLRDYGFHFSGDDALISELHRRRDLVKATAGSVKKRIHNPSLVCMDIERDSKGRFQRHR